MMAVFCACGNEESRTEAAIIGAGTSVVNGAESDIEVSATLVDVTTVFGDSISSSEDQNALSGGSDDKLGDANAIDGSAVSTSGEDVSEVVSDEGPDIDEIIRGMTLEEKIGQMMIVSYRVWQGTGGGKANVTELNDEIRASLRDYHFGGALLFAENFVDARQTLFMISDLQQSTLEGGGLPLFIMTDQEGGSVSRSGYGTYGVGNMALAATGDPANAKAMASIYGEELSLLGINTDFAPVLDINNNPSNPIIGVRSFSDSPEIVSEYGTAFIQGLHEKNTIATVKHFPGHGNTDTDSHTGFPCIQSTYDELKAFELIPFQNAINAGADMVMTAHIQYPNIESTTYKSISTGKEVYLPATMSQKVVTDILKGDMGFKGVVVSDALDMDAVAKNFKTEDIVKLSINAGVDMLILPCIRDRSLFQKNIDMIDITVRLVRDGQIDEARIDDAVRRILTLKKKYGILDIEDFSVSEDRVNAAVNGVGSVSNRNVAWDIAVKSLTIVKNEDAFPINPIDGENALIIFAGNCSNRSASADLAKQILEAKGVIPDGFEINVLINTKNNKIACIDAAKKADHVILVYRTYGAACLDPKTNDGFSSAVFDSIIDERHKEGKKVIVVSCQLPYDAARFADADALLLTYGSGVMSELPTVAGTGAGYIPNLPAALCACFGDGDANGTLPVNIPVLNESYSLSDNILFPRFN